MNQGKQKIKANLATSNKVNLCAARRKAAWALNVAEYDILDIEAAMASPCISTTEKYRWYMIIISWKLWTTFASCYVHLPSAICLNRTLCFLRELEDAPSTSLSVSSVPELLPELLSGMFAGTINGEESDLNKLPLLLVLGWESDSEKFSSSLSIWTLWYCPFIVSRVVLPLECWRHSSRHGW